MTTEKLKETFLKPLIAGATSALALRMTYGGDVDFQWGNSRYDVTKFGFALGVGNSFIAELVTQWITPTFVSSSGQRYVSLTWNLGVSALTYSSIPKLLNSSITSKDMLKLAGIGALVEIVSRYSYDNIIGGSNAIISY